MTFTNKGRLSMGVADLPAGKSTRYRNWIKGVSAVLILTACAGAYRSQFNFVIAETPVWPFILVSIAALILVFHALTLRLLKP